MEKEKSVLLIGFKMFAGLVWRSFTMHSRTYRIGFVLNIAVWLGTVWLLKFHFHHGWILSLFVGQVASFVFAIPNFIRGMKELQDPKRLEHLCKF
jgi:hypothetical protein